jgi:hypothetical protein
MTFPIHRQLALLPKYFPVGAVYVVEGSGGENGQLQVRSRYVVLPGGKRIDVPTHPGCFESARGLRRRRSQGYVGAQKQLQSRLGDRPTEPATRVKKFAVVAGTTQQERR